MQWWDLFFACYFIEANFDGPCGHWRPGDADLGTWDIISNYNSHLEIISQIEGSNGFQTAYRLEHTANLTMTAQEVFPQGTPFEFSFECTYRERQPQLDPWHLFHLTNSHEESQLSVTLNPGKQTLQVSLPDARGDLQIAEFRHSGVSRFSCLLFILHPLIFLLVNDEASKFSRFSWNYFYSITILCSPLFHQFNSLQILCKASTSRIIESHQNKELQVTKETFLLVIAHETFLKWF